jgi:hypothetical protein
MEPERAADGGWEAAIDPSLAARLLRPAVRPGLSDPAHGRTLAARLQCATAPTLADDLARRYGSTALGGNRPPVVYAAPPAPPAPAAAAGIDPGDDGVPRDPSSARAAPAGAEMDAGRPIVRAAERTSGPAFPPVRSADAGAAVQRRLDPVAAAVPVVAAPRAHAAAAPAGRGACGSRPVVGRARPPRPCGARVSRWWGRRGAGGRDDPIGIPPRGDRSRGPPVPGAHGTLRGSRRGERGTRAGVVGHCPADHRPRRSARSGGSGANGRRRDSGCVVAVAPGAGRWNDAAR